VPAADAYVDRANSGRMPAPVKLEQTELHARATLDCMRCKQFDAGDGYVSE
jgi:hypothetical protein